MLLNIPRRFLRSAITDEQGTVDGAVRLLEELTKALGLTDLSQSDVLDVGCGVKFTQAILNHGIPVGTYTGVDVYRDMIEFLRSEVRDPRFEYHAIDVRNELYNPDAPPMTTDTDLGLGDRTFDVICLYSVFTHLSPADYVTMLRLLRRHVRPGGRLAYTLFIDEPTAGAHGLIDFFERKLADAGSRPVSPEVAEAVRSVKPFRDADPTRP